MHRIAVIGTGYVGLVTGSCFAELGNRVMCVDVDEGKIATLQRGELPLYEPGLHDMVSRNQSAKRLSFSCDVGAAVCHSQIVIIAVGTPVDADGTVHVQYVQQAACAIGGAVNGSKVIVIKSTVPVGTADLVASIVRKFNTSGIEASVAANPEFLRQGSAVNDFLRPDRIVIGVPDKATEAVLRDLYAPLRAPIIVTDVRTAELIKYVANAFLAVKISFANEVASLCESVGADVKEVVAAVGVDKRINSAYMSAGLGFGGSCLPKDLRGLLGMARRSEVQLRLLPAALDVNQSQIERVVDKLAWLLGGLVSKRVALLGLAFKPRTDDVRESPALALAERLVSAGALVVAHDPMAIPAASRQLEGKILYADSWSDAIDGADAMIVATDWSEYVKLDFSRVRTLMAGRVVFDARNIYDAAQVTAHGLVYAGIGRRSNLGRLASRPAQTSDGSLSDLAVDVGRVDTLRHERKMIPFSV